VIRRLIAIGLAGAMLIVAILMVLSVAAIGSLATGPRRPLAGHVPPVVIPPVSVPPPAVPAPPGSTQRTLSVSGRPTLTVENPHGSITLTAGRDRQVMITARARDETGRRAGADLSIDQRGDQIVVRPGAASPPLDLVIELPVESEQVLVRAGTGDVQVEGLHGRIEIQVDNGNVSLRQLEGDLTVRGGNARIRIEQSRGRMRLTTRNGLIEARAIQSAGFEASADNGAVTVDGRFAGDGPHRITTRNGLLTVAFDRADNLRIEAVSNLCIMVSDLELRDRSESREGPCIRSLQGNLNEPESTLMLRAENGLITLRQR
jgi:hypothetical protein